MPRDMFALDDSLFDENKEKKKKDYSDELKRANIFCMREQYREALGIYNRILTEDMENEDAYIGILKAHSECFTKYDGQEIEKDIRIIERMFPKTMNEEYAKYCFERRKKLGIKTETKESTPKKVESKEKKIETTKQSNTKPVIISNASSADRKKIEKGLHFLSTCNWKRAIALCEEIAPGCTDIDYYYVYGFASYAKNQAVNAKKYLELVIASIDESHPYYLSAAKCLAELYSGRTGRAPIIDKDIYY